MLSTDNVNAMDAMHEIVSNMATSLNQVLFGQTTLINEILIALFSEGHILIEGMPGLGKTRLAKAIANYLNLPFSRIQCTPDLTPLDITGTEILQYNSSQSPTLEFNKGPIFTNILLVDEINRATPKTQSALLEAMQEHQVTSFGHTYPLSKPFIVIATQNPIELEGTYSLPEAQLDRFFSKSFISPPDTEAWLEIAKTTINNDSLPEFNSPFSAPLYYTLVNTIQNIFISDVLFKATADLILATHPERNPGSITSRYIRHGASPRGLQALLKAARVNALLNNRVQVGLTDIKHVALPVLRHRIITTLEAEIDCLDTDKILKLLIKEWEANVQ